MSSTSELALERRIETAWPIVAWRDSHVVLAVSAGPDSVAMMRAILAVKSKSGGTGQLFVAHFNHGIRGADADADQRWLEAVCRQLDVPFETARAEALEKTASRGDGWEAAARAARYEFLRRTAEKLGARFVAVGHTADDQVETVLHRILRGTGLSGLAGMSESRPLSPSVALIRPLLGVRRGEVLEYLAAIGQDYRIDKTNSDVRWTRNHLRHELLPILRARYNDAVDDALLRLSAQAAESQRVIDGLAQQIAGQVVLVDHLVQRSDNNRHRRVRLDCDRLRSQPMLLVREVCRIAWRAAGWPLQAMGFVEWQAIAELAVGSRNVPINLPGGVQARREREILVLELVASIGEK